MNERYEIELEYKVVNFDTPLRRRFSFATAQIQDGLLEVVTEDGIFMIQTRDIVFLDMTRSTRHKEDLLAAMQPFIRENQKIGAIKRIREITSWGLKEAKYFVDENWPGYQPFVGK